MKMILNHIEQGHYFCRGEEGKEVVKWLVINNPWIILNNLNFPCSEYLTLILLLLTIICV